MQALYFDCSHPILRRMKNIESFLDRCKFSDGHSFLSIITYKVNANFYIKKSASKFSLKLVEECSFFNLELF